MWCAGPTGDSRETLSKRYCLCLCPCGKLGNCSQIVALSSSSSSHLVLLSGTSQAYIPSLLASFLANFILHHSVQLPPAPPPLCPSSHLRDGVACVCLLPPRLCPHLHPQLGSGGTHHDPQHRPGNVYPRVLGLMTSRHPGPFAFYLSFPSLLFSLLHLQISPPHKKPSVLMFLLTSLHHQTF